MNVFLISLGSAASPIFHGGSSAGPGSNLHMVWPRRRGGRERTREGLKPSGPGRGPPGRRRGRRSSAVRAASLPPPAGAAAAPPGHRNVTAQRPSVGPSARPAPAPRRATRPASARVSEAASPLSPFSHTGWGGGGRLEGPGILRRGGGFNNHVVENVPAIAVPARPRLPLPFPRSAETPSGPGGRRDEPGARDGVGVPPAAQPGRGPPETERRKTSKSLRLPGRRRRGPSSALPSRRRLLLLRPPSLPPPPPGPSSLRTAKAAARERP